MIGPAGRAVVLAPERRRGSVVPPRKKRSIWRKAVLAPRIEPKKWNCEKCQDGDLLERGFWCAFCGEERWG